MKENEHGILFAVCSRGGGVVRGASAFNFRIVMNYTLFPPHVQSKCTVPFSFPRKIHKLRPFSLTLSLLLLLSLLLHCQPRCQLLTGRSTHHGGPTTNDRAELQRPLAGPETRSFSPGGTVPPLYHIAKPVCKHPPNLAAGSADQFKWQKKAESGTLSGHSHLYSTGGRKVVFLLYSKHATHLHIFSKNIVNIFSDF